MIDRKGVRYIAELLRARGPVHVTRLYTAVAGNSAQLPMGSGGDMLDDKAMAAYLKEAKDLEFRIREAEANHDVGLKEKLRCDLELLADQIASAKGLGGRRRQMSDDAEKIRQSVSKAITRAIGDIRECDPSLADYLDRNIRLGYEPEYTGELEWDFKIHESS